MEKVYHPKLKPETIISVPVAAGHNGPLYGHPMTLADYCENSIVYSKPTTAMLANGEEVSLAYLDRYRAHGCTPTNDLEVFWKECRKSYSQLWYSNGAGETGTYYAVEVPGIVHAVMFVGNLGTYALFEPASFDVSINWYRKPSERRIVDQKITGMGFPVKY